MPTCRRSPLTRRATSISRLEPLPEQRHRIQCGGSEEQPKGQDGEPEAEAEHRGRRGCRKPPTHTKNAAMVGYT